LIHKTEWCNRIIRVKVKAYSGQHEGRVGVLTGRRKNDGLLQAEMRNKVIDELASAMRTSKIMMHAPPDPPSAFVLYMRAQEREEGEDEAESLRKGHQLYLNLLPEDKDEYIRDACNLKVIREKQFAL
jgi:hypothetical protein